MSLLIKIILWLAGIVIAVLLGCFLARRALLPKAKRAEELQERLEKSFDSQKMLVSGISHELRTPLASMIAELEFTLTKQRTLQEYEDILKNVLHDARRIESLSKGLLDLARTEYNASEIVKEEVRLDETLLNVRDMVIKNNKDFSVNLIFDQETSDERQITVFGNEYLLKTAFINLIENNCKYSANKTSIVNIAFWNNNSIIRFSDTGTGIDKNEIDRIFAPFYRGENKNQAQGYGIGMALVSRILLLHNGKIAVHSSKGEGTVFVVSLPHV